MVYIKVERCKNRLIGQIKQMKRKLGYKVQRQMYDWCKDVLYDRDGWLIG